jgi:methylated-DNA-protein-cysteine methyltransferase related protein
MDTFKEKVIEVIKKVPKGTVVSYGQVAAYSGAPRAARAVGGILRAMPEDTKIPWWRVVNNKGLISIKGNMFCTKDKQRSLLEAEGVLVSNEFELDIKKYRFKL